MKVELFGRGKEVEVNENNKMEYTTTTGDVYEEAYELEDGKVVAFDEAVAAYVMLG